MFNIRILLTYIHFIIQINYYRKAANTIYKFNALDVTKLTNFHISKWWIYFLKNRYIIGHDAGSWLKVDSRTGEIQFSREFDKKSKYITNGIYTAEILAIDGKTFIFNLLIELLVCIKYEYYANVESRLTQIKYIIQGCLQDLQSSKCLRPRTEFSTLTTTVYTVITYFAYF